ncbi:MAG: primosomal protein N' [Congregibacter sp.]
MNPEDTILTLRLAVPAPLRTLFDYLPPVDVDPASIKPGSRLRVPFGRRELTAIMVEYSEATATDTKLRAAIAHLDNEPLLPPSLIALCKWSADYYQYPIGEVFSATLAKTLREGKELPRTAWRLTLRGHGLADHALRRAPSQARALAELQGGSREHQHLRQQNISSAVLRELENKALIERCEIELLTALPSDPVLRESGPALAQEQSAVLENLSLQGFGCHLLEGVTGSGKTEIYLRLMEKCLQRGLQTLLLVPEIGLTPQTLARFERRFNTPIAVMHSNLSDGQRLAAWQAARTGHAGIVIGTRSAIFTPMAQLGLIVVDEEHDTSYKQQDGFRYSARDLAIKRAQLDDCPVLLGTATPSLESLHNVQQGRYQHHRLRDRRGQGRLPELLTVDLRGLALNAGISDYLLDAVRDTVERNQQQALLFLNRRGYAPTLQCHHCGWIAGCENCDARLTVHLRKRCLRCHHCAARQPLAQRCPNCESTALLTHGLGTEQTEDYLRSALKCPVYRVDSDAMRGRDAMQSLLDIAEQGDPCVILGTQMLTKGHHFPAVQLVGVIDADALLYSADFRGEERMAQLITQVSGRAGRESAGGRVLVQTHYPEDPLFTALQQAEYSSIAAPLLEKRRPGALPPFGHLCMLRADAKQEKDGESFLTAVRRQAQAAMPADCRLIGPLPSSMPRRAGRFRWQIWCLAQTRKSAMQAARQLVQLASDVPRHRDLNWFIDIDPSDVQ